MTDLIPNMVHGSATIDMVCAPHDRDGEIIGRNDSGLFWRRVPVYSFCRAGAGYNYSVRGHGEGWTPAENVRNFQLVTST